MEWNASLLPPPPSPHIVFFPVYGQFMILYREMIWKGNSHFLEHKKNGPSTAQQKTKSIMRYNGMLHPSLFPIVFFPVSGQFMVLYRAMICKRELSCPETQQKWPLIGSNSSLFVAIFVLANKWVGKLVPRSKGWTYYEEELILWCLFTWQGLSQMTLFHTESYTFDYSNSGL